MSAEQPIVARMSTQGTNAAEKCLLAALILEPARVSEVAEIVRPEHFSTDRGQLLYNLLLELAGRGDLFDLTVVVAELRMRGWMDKIGGPNALLELSRSVTTGQHALYNAGIVRSGGLKRQVSALLTEAHQQVAKLEPNPQTVDKYMSDLQGKLVALDGYVAPTEIVRSREDAYKIATELMEPVGEGDGLRTGFYELDAMTHGLAPGQLIVLGARPRMGKTAFACTLLAHWGPAHDSKTFLMFSMEMTGREIMQRLVCARAKVSMHDIRTRGVRPGEDEALKNAADDLSQSNLVVRDSAGMFMHQIMQYARQVQYKHGLHCIVIDYAQLIRGDAKKSRYEVVTESSRLLKELAKKLNVPVLALAQLSRRAEGGERPGLEDLRESGALEQDADGVWLLHRPEVHDPKPENEGLAELIVAKCRNGPTGIVRLSYNHGAMTFYDPTPKVETPF